MSSLLYCIRCEGDGSVFTLAGAGRHTHVKTLFLALPVVYDVNRIFRTYLRIFYRFFDGQIPIDDVTYSLNRPLVPLCLLSLDEPGVHIVCPRRADVFSGDLL
jgi:hypothetical protein